MNPYKDIEESSFTATPHLTYEDIATKLLKEHFFLTALELHTELVESGKELPQLREFFSNPGNFEQHVSRASDLSSMHRTPSQATLDSLDAARYSEDGGGDRCGSGGDVAVLEFELRKARETINALRANLTQFADGDTPLDKNPKGCLIEHSLKPHEKRALNFLINEYLLNQDYKLTSITFSDENPDQDFEDWDDIGLNIPRPSGLVSLFWRGKSGLKVGTSDISTQVEPNLIDSESQTDLIDETNVCVSCQTSFDQDTDWNHELLIQAEEIVLLKQKIIVLETEKLNFQKLYDAAIVSLNSLTSPTTETKCLELNMPEMKSQTMTSDYIEPPCDQRPLTLTATDNHYGSNTHSTHSATPEQFELIDNEKHSLIRKDGSNTSSFDPVNFGESSARDSPLRRGSVTTLDETLSINDGGEWMRVHYEYGMETNTKDMWIDSRLPNSMKVCLLKWCCETLNSNEPINNDLLTDLMNSDKAVNLQGLLTIVADTIPRVIPHTLVARRCEAVALLVATIHLLSMNELSDATRRTRLLHLLLTLKKMPDPSEVRIICEAVRLIVKWGGSGEVLSCIAELLASRTSERRVLASQICLAIAPYVSIELCTSLLLSLVLLMCESSEVEIRILGLKAACIICPVSDHKYGQLENILFGFLRDPSEVIVKDTVGIFVPVLARTALIAGKFPSDLSNRIITNLIKASNEKEWKIVILYLNIMKMLVSADLAYVINVQIIKDVTLTNCDSEIMNYQDVSLENEQDALLDIQCFITDSSMEGKSLIIAMNSILKDKPEVRWSELNWFIYLIKKLLDISVTSKCLNQATAYEQFILLFSTYVENFGPQFTCNILKPIFMEIISDLEQKMEKLHTITNENTIVVGIYLVTVLPASEDNEEFKSFLHKWIVYSSIRSLPVKIFSVPLKWVGKHKSESLQYYIQLLREFTVNGGESASGVAVKVYICNLITELLNLVDVQESCIDKDLLPMIVTLMNDGDVSVRECAITAWGGVTRAARGEGAGGAGAGGGAEARCWAAMAAAAGAALSAREAARAAEALALLILPAADVRAPVCTEAVRLVCALCVRAPLTGESLGALAPGLQLAALHARAHPALAPALRKVEEAVQAPSLAQYKPAIEALVHNVIGSSGSASSDASPRDAQLRNTSSNLQAAQEAVGRRVTQMFQQSKSNMNLPNIFKKKS